MLAAFRPRHRSHGYVLARQSGVPVQAASFDLRLIQMPGLAGHPRRMNSGGNFLAVYSKSGNSRRAPTSS